MIQRGLEDDERVAHCLLHLETKNRVRSSSCFTGLCSRSLRQLHGNLPNSVSVTTNHDACIAGSARTEH